MMKPHHYMPNEVDHPSSMIPSLLDHYRPAPLKKLRIRDHFRTWMQHGPPKSKVARCQQLVDAVEEGRRIEVLIEAV